MRDAEASISSATTGRFHRFVSDRWLVALVTVCIAARAIWWISTPFVIEGDGVTYDDMLRKGESSLLHASGYVWCLRPLAWFADWFSLDVARLVRFVVPLVAIGAVVALFVAMRNLVGPVIAFSVGVLLGSDTLLLAAACTPRPEALQSALGTFAISIAIWMLERPTRAVSARWGALLGASLMLAFLVKFNAIALTPLLLVPFAARGRSLLAKLRTVSVAGLGAATVLFLFLSGFHRPATGTWTLNAGDGWYRMANLEWLGIEVLPTAGPASSLCLALLDEMPPVVPSEQPFRRWKGPGPGWTDGEFEAFASAHAKRSSPSAPLNAVRDVRKAENVTSLYVNLGLARGEKLLRAVNRETIANDPAAFASAAAKLIPSGLQTERHYVPFMPIRGLEDEWIDATDGVPLRRVRSILRLGNTDRPEYAAAIAGASWRPGLIAASHIGVLRHVPSWAWVGLILAGCVLGAVRAVRAGRADPCAMASLLLVCAIACLHLVSALTLSFRSKELILCLPWMVVAAAVALWPGTVRAR